MSTPNKTRAYAAAEAALEAFWAAVANAYPEATTGDLELFAVMKLSNAARDAVTEWAAINVPGDDS